MTQQLARVTLPDIQRPVAGHIDQVVEELRRIIAASFPIIAEVNEHLLRMKGKLFRPTLLLLSGQAAGAAEPRSVTLAAIVELIHLATLVHDDSVDHSPLRVFARVTNEMTVGEMRQLEAHDKLTYAEEQYDALIEAKTASLLSAACEVGALRGAPAHRDALARFGHALGMAFQITDDLLDYTQPEAVTGKPSGLDLKEHKVTLPLIAALERMGPGERRRVADLMATAEPADEQVADVIRLVETAGGLEYARRNALEHAQRAEAELETLPPSPARDALRDSITYAVERRS